MLRHKSPAEKFNPGDKVWATQEGNKRSAAIIIERASYGGGYYAAYDPRNPNRESFWTCDTYCEARES
jgi:hypothetical protein